LTELRSD